MSKTIYAVRNYSADETIKVFKNYHSARKFLKRIALKELRRFSGKDISASDLEWDAHNSNYEVDIPNKSAYISSYDIVKESK